MKKFLLLSLVSLIPAFCHSQELKKPVYQPLTLNTMTLYVVGGSTYGACNVDISATQSSFTVRCTGLATAATGFTLANYTIDQAIAFLNGYTGLVLGGDGKIYASKVQGCYGDQSCSMFNVTNYSCRNSSNVATITQGSTLGISYILNPPSNVNTQYRLGDFVGNATFNTGNCYVNVYESTAAVASAQVRKERITISGIDAALNTSSWFNSSPAKYWRFDIVNSSNVTDGYINLSYFAAVSQ